MITSFVSIFFESVGCLFTSFVVSFATQKLSSLGPRYFCFYFHYFERWVKKDVAVIYVTECPACFPLEFYSVH